MKMVARTIQKVLVALFFLMGAIAFVPTSGKVSFLPGSCQYQRQPFLSQSVDSSEDSSEIVAKRIIVTGDVQGGYYRSCVRNEAGRFRRLVGTMSPPDDTDNAEIYVEGKRKMVDGFVRWCKKGDVGLSQVVAVQEVIDEEPTGLYDDFYVKTH